MSEYKRRPRYSGKHPRKFSEKYKEHRGDDQTLQKVMQSGKTPAGMHRSIMLDEIVEFLQPQPGMIYVDATLGYGGHTSAIAPKLAPHGIVVGIDTDAQEMQRTLQRLKENWPEGVQLIGAHSNYAGLGKVLAANGIQQVDCMLADLGLSSMQIDNPGRGFSFKHEGPLDMRMNQSKGLSARELIIKTPAEKIAGWLLGYSDEPRAELIAAKIAGKDFPSTLQLANCICEDLPLSLQDATLRRCFQAIRIAVNEELSALERFLHQAAFALRSGGRLAILSFHSGEDRRVKHFFKQGLADGIFSAVSDTALRPSREEVFTNSRASSAKLRWAIKA